MKLAIFILFILFIASQMELTAQYTIPSSVLGNGGTLITGGANNINGTVGQPLIDISTGTTNKVLSGFWNTIIINATGINDETGNNLFSEEHLGQNYPNPFNTSTTISYDITRISRVNLSIFNVLGEKVVTLVNETKQTGNYTMDWDATNFQSGTYFCRLEIDDRAETSVLNLFR
ncbi:MAG: T9SS type A sorting domain-containing protein [Bacteroidetes bacterium]|nr:MAG: T9SS type A sorting domain-containing protein [Bacteroidota bacterium]